MMAAASPEVPSCDTELSFGGLNPATTTPRWAREEEEACATPCAAAAAAAAGGGSTATELQAAAILRMARRTAAEGTAARRTPPGDAHGLSMRRSLEWFLERRWEERRQHGVAVASPSSSSCLTTDA